MVAPLQGTNMHFLAAAQATVSLSLTDLGKHSSYHRVQAGVRQRPIQDLFSQKSPGSLFKTPIVSIMRSLVDRQHAPNPARMYKVVVFSIHPGWEDLNMSITPIDLDEEALAAAMAELGTSTKKDTVNTALREIAARNSRQRALERLLQLGDPEAGLQVWRARKGLDLSDAEAN